MLAQHQVMAWRSTPLHHAIEREEWENVAVLLDSGARLNQPDKKGQTLLHKAVSMGRRDLVEKLLAAGADRDVKDKKGRTPGALAFERGDFRLQDYLEAPPESTRSVE